MFNKDRREIFSLRKYKNGRTDSKLIGATVLGLGLGFVTTGQVSADVVNGAGGSEVALVNNTDKTTAADTNTFTDDTNPNKIVNVDAVLDNGVAEPTRANENKGAADGSDTVTLTSETTVNYKLESDNSLLKTDTVSTGQGTVTTPYDKKGIAADTDGKDYRESSVDKSGIAVSEETGKQDTLEVNGKVYERTRSEVEGADKAKYSKTSFNDIEATVSPEGMHNKLGEIDYTKTTGKVYLVEETSDGQYGKFVEANGVSSDDDAVSKWKAGLAGAKDFTKANVTLQEGDSIVVLDKDTYAVSRAKIVKTRKKFASPTYPMSPGVVDRHHDDGFGAPTFFINDDSANSDISIVEAGQDGRFKTSDDTTVESVGGTNLFNFETSNFIYEENPYFKLKPKKDDAALQNPTVVEALKNNDSYRYLFSLLDFAEKEANTEASRAKVADVKAKINAYFDELPAKLKAVGVDVVWVNDHSFANSYVFYGPNLGPSQIDELRGLVSPQGKLGEILNGLTFTHEDKTEEMVESVKVTTTVSSTYSIDSLGSIEVEKVTTKHHEGRYTLDTIFKDFVDTSTTEEPSTDLLKKGSVKVNSDGSVTITSKETLPVVKVYKGEPEDGVIATLDGGVYVATDDSGLARFTATETTSHNETTYRKHELITPIRAYKVVSDGMATVTHYYREKKAPLTVNYYLENTTTSLAPSDHQADLPVKSDYTTQPKTIAPKTVVQDLPEKIVTTVTTYELVAAPDNANGKIAEGGTTVTYYYRAVDKVTEVAKKAPVTVNYYKEGTTEKLAPSDEQGMKDIGSAYTSVAKTIAPKVETQDLADRVVTTMTTYELVSEPADKEGTVPVGGKVVNYYYREVVKRDEKMKTVSEVVTWHNETNFDVKHVFDRELEKDLVGFSGDNSIFVNQKYGALTSVARRVYDASIGFSAGDVRPSDDKILEKENAFAKMVGYASKDAFNKDKSNDTLDLATHSLLNFRNVAVSIQPDLTSGVYNLTDRLADFSTRNVMGDLDVFEGKDQDTLNTYESKLPDGVQLELTKVTYNIDGGEEKTLAPKDVYFGRKNGTMQEGKTTHFTYHYRVVKHEAITNTEDLVGSVVVKYVTTDGVEIKEPVTLKNKANAGQRVTKSLISGTANLGSKTEDVAGSTRYDANTVKEEHIEKDNKRYVLTRVLPKDATLKNTDQVEGVVKPGTTTIVYEYREVQKGDVVANYYLEGTETKLADSDNQAPAYYGTAYTTIAKTIKPKIDVVDTAEKTITRTTTYELVAKPSNAEGEISSERTVVNYYYRAVVKENVVMKQAPVTINYYKEGTTEKLAPSDEQGMKDIGSVYTSEAKTIAGRVEKVVEDGNTVTRTTTYQLVKTPEDKEGVVPVGGKVVNYYYREVVTEVAKPNDAPKVEIPEFNGGVVPMDPPVVEKPELKIPDEEPVEPAKEPNKPMPKASPVEQLRVEAAEESPQAPKVAEKEPVLPNTGDSNHTIADALGASMLASVIGLFSTRRKKSD